MPSSVERFPSFPAELSELWPFPNAPLKGDSMAYKYISRNVFAICARIDQTFAVIYMADSEGFPLDKTEVKKFRLDMLPESGEVLPIGFGKRYALSRRKTGIVKWVLGEADEDIEFGTGEFPNSVQECNNHLQDLSASLKSIISNARKDAPDDFKEEKLPDGESYFLSTAPAFSVAPTLQDERQNTVAFLPESAVIEYPQKTRTVHAYKRPKDAGPFSKALIDYKKPDAQARRFGLMPQTIPLIYKPSPE